MNQDEFLIILNCFIIVMNLIMVFTRIKKD